MKPGRDLDALIAEKVMGLELKQPIGTKWMRDTWVYAINDYKNSGPVYVVDCPAYSTSIEAAWPVMERLCQLPYQKGDEPGTDVRLQYCYRRKVWDCNVRNDEWIIEQAETAPHAICLAALKAVGAL